MSVFTVGYDFIDFDYLIIFSLFQTLSAAVATFVRI